MTKRMLTLLKTGNHIAIVGDRSGKPMVTSMSVVRQAQKGFYDAPITVLQSYTVIRRIVRVGTETMGINDELYLQTARFEGAGEVLEVECAFDEIEHVWYVQDSALVGSDVDSRV